MKKILFLYSGERGKLLKLIDSDTWRFFNFEVWYYCEFQNDWITYLKERNRK